MIQHTIDTINSRITEQIATELIQVAGIAVPFQDQQEKAITLKLGTSRFSIDDRLAWQSVHLTDGSSITTTRTFGSFTDLTHDVKFILIGISKAKSGIDVAYRALDGVGYVVIDDREVDSLTVLSRYFRIKSGQDKNYDPDLYAFAIRYHIVGVTDEDFAELPDAEDQAELPVIVPEPEVITVLTPGTGTGSAYAHNQSIPANTWLITHNLGYRPGGIVVFDSASNQWLAEVEYLTANTLNLHFGLNSFSGVAYIS